MVPEEPVDATVVATVMFVTAEFVVEVVDVYAPLPPVAAGFCWLNVP